MQDYPIGVSVSFWLCMGTGENSYRRQLKWDKESICYNMQISWGGLTPVNVRISSDWITQPLLGLILVIYDNEQKRSKSLISSRLCGYAMLLVEGSIGALIGENAHTWRRLMGWWCCRCKYRSPGVYIRKPFKICDSIHKPFGIWHQECKFFHLYYFLFLSLILLIFLSFHFQDQPYSEIFQVNFVFYVFCIWVKYSVAYLGCVSN